MVRRGRRPAGRRIVLTGTVDRSAGVLAADVYICNRPTREAKRVWVEQFP